MADVSAPLKRPFVLLSKTDEALEKLEMDLSEDTPRVYMKVRKRGAGDVAFSRERIERVAGVEVLSHVRKTRLWRRFPDLKLFKTTSMCEAWDADAKWHIYAVADLGDQYPKDSLALKLCASVQCDQRAHRVQGAHDEAQALHRAAQPGSAGPRGHRGHRDQPLEEGEERAAQAGVQPRGRAAEQCRGAGPLPRAEHPDRPGILRQSGGDEGTRFSLERDRERETRRISEGKA
eukprot:scaffold434_cov186-Pinguiococcus_pyrenoidosus.AAC.76